MSIVLDANMLVVLVSGDPRAEIVNALVEEWLSSSESLHAPELTPFEIANALTRLVAAGAFPVERVATAWGALRALPITFHPLLDGGPRVVEVARQLDRHSAYDAAYLVLAEDLDAMCWTLDARLARNASRIGLPVRLAVHSASPKR
jgi:predicted nucleic acid-binding protein